MQKVITTILEILFVFAVMTLIRFVWTYGNPDQIRSDLVTAVILGSLSAITNRGVSYNTRKFEVVNWDDFWRDFTALVRDTDFNPVCQMDQTYFFEKRWLFHRGRLTLKKISAGLWEVEYPQGMNKKIQKQIGIYDRSIKLPLS